MNNKTTQFMLALRATQPNKWTQSQKLLWTLAKGGVVDGNTAMRDLLIYRLSARIKNLRDMGFVIHCDTKSGTLGKYYMKSDHRDEIRSIA